MRTPASAGWYLSAAVGVLAALAAQALAQPAPGANYGPCCPLVRGQKAPQAHSTATGSVLRGPRYVCATTPVTLAYGDQRHAVAAMEVTGSLLLPARVFGLTGADLEWGGNRRVVVSRGPRRVELTLGSAAVAVNDGQETQTQSWPLCPRLLNGTTYAPLRPLATALGLTVAFAEGTVTLGEAGAAVPGGPATAAASCPADRVEAALGVTLVRSPADSAFGVGAGIVAVRADALAATLGVQAKDVIIAANGTAVKCPKDLDALLTRLQASGGTVTSLVVARGGEKLTLGAGQ